MLNLKCACVLIFAAFSVVTARSQTLEASGGVSGDGTLARPVTQTAMNASIIDFANSEISLVSYASSRCASLPFASLPADTFDALRPLLPYSVSIRNDGRRTVLAYTVSWVSIDGAGQVHTDYRTTCDCTTLTGLIPPNGDVLTSIVTPSPLNRGSIAEQARQFQDQKSVAISLEAIVFLDGSVEGKDSVGAVNEVKARLRSEYDLYRAVVAKSGSDSSLTAWLQVLADQYKPGTKIAFSNDSYSDWYRFRQARSASGLLRMTANRGVGNMVAYVEATLQTKHYPVLIVAP